MSNHAEQNNEIWSHWGYAVFPVFLISFSIFCMIITLVPQFGSFMGVPEQSAARIRTLDTQVVLLMILGFSFWPLKWTLSRLLIEGRKRTRSYN